MNMIVTKMLKDRRVELLEVDMDKELKIDEPLGKVFFKSNTPMFEVLDSSVDLIITSPPYFNIKDYAKNGYQDSIHSVSHNADLGTINNYKTYINALLKVWYN